MKESFAFSLTDFIPVSQLIMKVRNPFLLLIMAIALLNNECTASGILDPKARTVKTGHPRTDAPITREFTPDQGNMSVMCTCIMQVCLTSYVCYL